MAKGNPMLSAYKWWQKTTVYQIYPRSFADGNNDGVGDIQGIISKLDYLKDMGFETVWFSPLYKGPQADHGYDISDYCAISPEYGDVSDAERLIAEVHARGMKVAFDMVMNHTSVEHPWFQESRSSCDNPKRDWYIWRDGKGSQGSQPPNNWSSFVTDRGWQYDTKTGQWYCASFFEFQPDLNYDNPEVKKAMFDVLRFWLAKGVDGFRLDIFHAIHKDDQFRDNPFRFKFFPTEDDHDGYFQSRIHTVNHPKNFVLAKELRSVLGEFDKDRFAVGEVAGKPEVIKQYLGESHDGLNLIFMFETLRFKFTAAWFRDFLQRLETEFPYPYIPTYVFGNHDQQRFMKKLGNDVAKAKLMALLQFTARGVPVTYYGEEIGMKNANISLNMAGDPLARLYRWIPQKIADKLGLADLVIRERARTPMQWTGGPNGGFCSADVRPWVASNPDVAEVNVATQQKDPASLLNTYKRLLHARNTHVALQEGTIRLLDAGDVPADVLAYVRESGGKKLLIVMNFGNKVRKFRNRTTCTQVVFATDPGLQGQLAGADMRLQPCSGVILKD